MSHFVAGLEKNKLFVKDLNKETTRDHLEEVFAKFGLLKEVRLITLRNGHSKGLAFVEYADEVSAAKALLQTDGELSLIHNQLKSDCIKCLKCELVWISDDQ